VDKVHKNQPISCFVGRLMRVQSIVYYPLIHDALKPTLITNYHVAKGNERSMQVLMDSAEMAERIEILFG